MASSTNRRVVHEGIEGGRSLRNKRAPRTLPWETPDFTGRRSDMEPLTDTHDNGICQRKICLKPSP